VRRRRPWLALLLLAAGAGGGWWLARGAPAPAARPPSAPAPLVRTVAVDRRDVQLSVTAHGTVQAPNEVELVPEVAGRVEWVSPSLVAGGFVDAGEPLLRLDHRDYESALHRAEARLRRARSERSLARDRLERHEALAERDATSAVSLDQARNAAEVSAAKLAEAVAARDEAARQLARTTLEAPFAARVRRESVSLGQYLPPGEPVARLYGVDYFEVRLPVPHAELAHIEVPPAPSRDTRSSNGSEEVLRGPPVTLRARYAGAARIWSGRIVRSEGQIEPRSRMVHLVARVDDPQGRERSLPGATLPVGLFVRAEIAGRRVEDALLLPPGALREDDRVLAIDAEERLRPVALEILHTREDAVVARGPLESGDLVALSPLPGATPGMRVRTERAVEAAP